MYKFLVALMSMSAIVNAQQKNADVPVSADTTAKPSGAGTRPPVVPRPYKDVVTARAVTQNGLFKVHKIDDRYLFEIADSLLGRDLLIVNRIAKTSTAFSISSAAAFAGDIINEKEIRFDKGPNNKIFLRTVSYSVYSNDSTMPMYRSVMGGIQPISAAFDIKAFSPDGKGTVIDLTDYVNTDNDILGFDTRIKTSYGLSAQMADRSYILNVRSYPVNTEIRTLKTYTRAGATTGPGVATIEMNSSMLLLPKLPMKGRYYDERIGFFTTGYVDFDVSPQSAKSVQLITRWRLEPREEDIEKYLRGELVQPKKPIVIYIDPATPEKWVPYLIQGINDWQTAFEKAGFKNAIMGQRAPTKEQDSSWSLEDARYSALVYKPSIIANASGPQVHDPRSGEIIETHINWYHNVLSLLHSWYFIQASPTDPRARKMEFDDELMGRLVRFVACHEVGHTLGLRHNFAASSTVPVEKLRDNEWLSANGHTPSIMDYARFNYVAQPEDHISPENLMPHIGEYDKWAIEWGYRWLPQFKTAKEEETYLNQWTVKKLSDKRLLFGGEGGAFDPRIQMEDLGDNSMKAGEYGIRNLKRIVANLEAWTRMPNDHYTYLDDLYGSVISQFGNYILHVLKNIGTTMTTPKSVEQEGPVYEDVPAARQRQAMAFINKQVFQAPTWLLNKDILKKTDRQALEIITTQQSRVLQALLNGSLLEKMTKAEVMNPAAYKVSDLLADLQKYVWTELTDNRPIDVFRRSLQKIYIEKLKALMGKPGSASINQSIGTSTSDAASLIRAHARSLREKISARLRSSADSVTRYHLQDLLWRLDEIFKATDG